MFVSGREMLLNGKPVVVGQVLDSIWPTLRERTRRALLANKQVLVVASTVGIPSTGGSTGPYYDPPPSTTATPTTTRKRGRPKKVSA